MNQKYFSTALLCLVATAGVARADYVVQTSVKTT